MSPRGVERVGAVCPAVASGTHTQTRMSSRQRGHQSLGAWDPAGSAGTVTERRRRNSEARSGWAFGFKCFTTLATARGCNVHHFNQVKCTAAGH